MPNSLDNASAPAEHYDNHAASIYPHPANSQGGVAVVGGTHEGGGGGPQGVQGMPSVSPLTVCKLTSSHMLKVL